MGEALIMAGFQLLPSGQWMFPNQLKAGNVNWFVGINGESLPMTTRLCG
jgi:hypothetical protein